MFTSDISPNIPTTTESEQTTRESNTLLSQKDENYTPLNYIVLPKITTQTQLIPFVTDSNYLLEKND